MCMDIMSMQSFHSEKKKQKNLRLIESSAYFPPKQKFLDEGSAHIMYYEESE